MIHKILDVSMKRIITAAENYTVKADMNINISIIGSNMDEHKLILMYF